MRYLADSHVVLWFLTNSPRLMPRHRRVLMSSAIVYFSPVSLAELAIKFSKGRLPVSSSFFDRVEAESGLVELPFRAAHAVRMRDLPRHHGDPFDRMLIAQAVEEGLTLLTTDRKVPAYGVRTV